MDVLNSPNLTAEDTQSSGTAEWSQYQIILSLVFSLIGVTTVVANSVVLYLFYKSKRVLRSPSHILLANLGLADLLVGLVVMPIMGSITVATKYRWIWGPVICFLSDYLHFSLCATSMLSLVAVAFDRFVGVRFPLKHKRIMTRKRVLQMISLIWFLAISLTAVPLSVWPFPQVVPSLCVPNLNQQFALFVSGALYLVPVSVTAVLYILVFMYALRPFGLVNKTPTNTLPHGLVNPKTFPADRQQLRLRAAEKKQSHLAKKLGLFIIVMLVMFGPMFAVFMLAGLGRLGSPIDAFDLLIAVAWLRYANSCVNPFLFGLAVPGYRKEFFRIFLNERRGSADSEFTSDTDSDYEGSDEDEDTQSELPSRKISQESQETQEVDLIPTDGRKGLELVHRFCTYCGGKMTRDDLDRPGKNQLCYCIKCFKSFTEGQVVFTDSGITYNKVSSVTTPPVVNEEPLEATSVSEDSRREIEDTLLFEIQRYLKSLNDKKVVDLAPEGLKPEDPKKNRESQLLSNLKKISPIIRRGTNEGLKEMRKSLMSPILKSRSEMINLHKNPNDIDWDSIKELDEIIVKLDSTVFGTSTATPT